MPTFVATFVLRDGRRRRSRVDAVDGKSLIASIEGAGNAFVIGVRTCLRKPARSSAKVSTGMLLSGMDSLHFMLMTGVKINSALRVLSECAPPGRARRLWSALVMRIEETGSFHAAISDYPRIFDPSVVGIIGAHENAGRLAQGVCQARGHILQMDSLRRDSARSIAYPLFVCAMGLVASLVLCFFTLPRFSAMLRDIGVTHANPVTGFFFGLSNLMVHHPRCALLAATSPFLMAWAGLRPFLKPLRDQVAFRMPVVGRVVRSLALARICSTFHVMSDAGIRVVETIEYCEKVAGNMVLSRGLSHVARSVKANESVGTGFEKALVFSPELVLAVKCGEGNLTQVFGRLSGYYRDEARHSVSVALRLLEPAMLLFVLVWVFGVALAVVLPVVDIINEIH